MPYIKLLTVLAGLALLTACGGAAAPDNTDNTGGGTTSDDPCVTNPFGTTCTNPTETQQVTFCRDEGKTTDTKTDDCIPTITRVCTANVFDTLCTAPTQQEAEVFCGDDTKTTNTKTNDCADTITDACTANFRHTLCDDIKEYEDKRTEFNNMCINQAGKTPQICENDARIATCDADEFATNCAEQKYVDERRMTCLTAKTTTRCMPTVELICGTNGDIFDPFCTGLTDTDMTRQTACLADIMEDDSCRGDMGIATVFCKANLFDTSNACMHGDYNDDRETICQTHGTDETDGHATCATILIPLCTIDNPFAHAGCDDVANINADIRTPYCQTPVNAWNPKCMETMHGTVTATRVTACQMFGTDTDTGGHASCADSLASSCTITDPFIHEGCNNVVGIDAGFRTTYCALTVNAFKTKCKTDGTHGDVLAARGKACVEFGIDTMTGGHGSCIGNTLAESSCAMNPFDLAKPGCAILTEFPMIVETYCGSNPSIDECGVKTSTWVENARNADNTAGLAVRGIRDARANDTQYTLITGGAESLELGDAVTKHATNFGDLTFKNTEVPANGTFIGETAFIGNPNVAGGISYATNAGGTQLYAGLLSDTKVGAPLEAAPTANWLGRLGIIRGENIAATAFHNVADFQLVIDFTNTTLSQTVALSNRETDFYAQFIIAGKFNDKGVIFGTATYEIRRTAGNGLESSGTGILTGLIGQKGAAAVFHGTSGATDFVGGFVAVPYVPEADDDANKVTFNDWVRDFGPNPPPAMLTATTPATARQREFLAGGTAGLDETGAVSILANRALTLDSARYNGEPLGGAGDEKDGYGLFFDTVASNNQVLYAGLLSDTDLGAPLTQASGSVTWYGQIQIFRGSSLDTTPAHDFTLEITFGAKVGVDGSVGSIEGFVENNDGVLTTQYRVAGTYDAGGVITGTTTRAGFSGSDTGQLAAATPNGILTGLIGEQGAVGVFQQAETGSTKDNIIDSGAGLPYVGGFVASQSITVNLGKAVYWAEQARNADNTAGLAVRGIRDARADDTQYTLITGGAESLELGDAVTKDATNFGDLTFKNTEVPANGTFRGETAFIGNPNVAGGISYATNVGATKLYAGLLSDTKVGAPLEAAPTANWLGRLGIISGENITATAFHAVVDFQLVIDFTNTTLSQTVALSNRETTFYEQFVIAGKFNDKGVIFGTATYELRRTDNNNRNSSGTGILTGLIGQKGAAAVFHRTSGRIDFVGGFVAVPPPPPSVATHANFKTYYADSARANNRTLHPDLTTGGPYAFVEATATSLPTTGLIFTATQGASFVPRGQFMPITVKLGGAVQGDSGFDDIDDGFAVMLASTTSANDRYRAGLLSGTDLGPALDNTVSTAWTGKLYTSVLTDGTLSSADLSLTLNFTAGTIETTSAVNPTGNHMVSVNGKFGSAHSLPDGILGGTVTYNAGTDTELPLIGLIGTEGVIGVFQGFGGGFGGAGGFQASPN